MCVRARACTYSLLRVHLFCSNIPLIVQLFRTPRSRKQICAQQDVETPVEAPFRDTFLLSLQDVNADACKSASPLSYFRDMFSSLRVQVKGGKLRTELWLLPHVTSQGSPKLCQPGS